MSWTTFDPSVTATLPQLDTNFSVLSGLTPIPCTVAGTNTVTLTSIAGAATISAYANYMRFTGIAAHSNTGAVTAQFGSLAALNVYKDTPAGPVVLVGNEIIINNEFTLVYDLALNTGAGGFHLKTGGSELVGQTITLTRLNATTETVTNATITALASIGTLMIGASASMGQFFVGASASALTRLMTSTASVVFGGAVSFTNVSATVALTGASVGDVIGVGFLVAPPAGAVVQGYVGAASSVILRSHNVNNASLAGFTTTLRVQSMGYT